jgi:hypothetical protein
MDFYLRDRCRDLGKDTKQATRCRSYGLLARVQCAVRSLQPPREAGDGVRGRFGETETALEFSLLKFASYRLSFF